MTNEGALMAPIGHNHLEGQRALVTGATSGIGRAVALQLDAALAPSVNSTRHTHTTEDLP